jgi:hypothetical protein
MRIRDPGWKNFGTLPATMFYTDFHFTQASPIKNRDMAELQEHLATQLATQHRGTYSRPSLNHITTLMCQV